MLFKKIKSAPNIIIDIANVDVDRFHSHWGGKTVYSFLRVQYLSVQCAYMCQSIVIQTNLKGSLTLNANCFARLDCFWFQSKTIYQNVYFYDFHFEHKNVAQCIKYMNKMKRKKKTEKN